MKVDKRAPSTFENFIDEQIGSDLNAWSPIVNLLGRKLREIWSKWIEETDFVCTRVEENERNWSSWDSRLDLWDILLVKRFTEKLTICLLTRGEEWHQCHSDSITASKTIDKPPLGPYRCLARSLMIQKPLIDSKLNFPLYNLLFQFLLMNRWEFFN